MFHQFVTKRRNLIEATRRLSAHSVTKSELHGIAPITRWLDTFTNVGMASLFFPSIYQVNYQLALVSYLLAHF